MSDDRSTFEVTRARLEDIVAQVRRKDVSLEQSLDLLEEAVRLVNQCNDLIDQTSFRAAAAEDEGSEAVEGMQEAAGGPQEPADSEEGAIAPAQDVPAPQAEDASGDGEAIEADEATFDVTGAVILDEGDFAVVEFFEATGVEEAAMPVAEIEDDERS